MNDRELEQALERYYTNHASAPDDAAFVVRIVRRHAARRLFRFAVLGGFGIVGGVLTFGWLLESNVLMFCVDLAVSLLSMDTQSLRWPLLVVSALLAPLVVRRVAQRQ